ELRSPGEDERVERPRLGLAAKAMDRARRAVLRWGRSKEGAGVALRLVRDREAVQGFAEDGDEPKRGTIDLWPVEARARPFERREQPEVVGAPVPIHG